MAGSYFTRSPDSPITRFLSGLLRSRRIALLRPWRSRLLLAFYLLWRREDCVQRISFHPRTEFNDCALADFVQQAFQHLASQIGMGHFAAAEEDGGLNLVALFEEAEYVVLFELVVVLVHVDAELYFLDRDYLLVLLCRALLLFFLVQVLAVILDAADGRIRCGRDLYQVVSTLAGDLEGFKGLHHTKLSAVFVDYTDFAGANSLIGTDSTAAKTFIDTFLRGIARDGAR